MKYDFHIETFAIGKWLRIVTGSREYCRGYMSARLDYSPRLAYRIVRSDGLQLDHWPEKADVSIGQIAGWPSSEQYVAAAEKALATAIFIREQEGKRRR